MEQIIKYVIPSMSNYNVINYPNLFNFLYTIYLKQDEKCKKDFIVNMKLFLGLTFTNDFKAYIFRKVNNSESIGFFE